MIRDLTPEVCTEHDLPPDTIKLPRNVLSILLPTFPVTLLSVRSPHCLKGYFINNPRASGMRIQFPNPVALPLRPYARK
ncbi:hypothetical protein AC423_001077 [Salmonella enterica subsp. enterica]|nr:hypothetical protein [Salmonella enterica subsp. enterica]